MRREGGWDEDGPTCSLVQDRTIGSFKSDVTKTIPPHWTHPFTPPSFPTSLLPCHSLPPGVHLPAHRRPIPELSGHRPSERLAKHRHFDSHDPLLPWHGLPLLALAEEEVLSSKKSTQGHKESWESGDWQAIYLVISGWRSLSSICPLRL